MSARRSYDRRLATPDPTLFNNLCRETPEDLTVIDFQPDKYGSCAPLLRDAATAPLGPGTPNPHVHSQLKALTVDSIAAGRPLKDTSMAECCLAAVWLLHNYLDESHSMSQSIATPTGSYWHGLMHRREPDFSNAKYWFRRVGDHPVFADLHQEVHQLAEDAPLEEHARRLDPTSWDPFGFVDLCEVAIRERGTLESFCCSVAELEWQLLFDHCYQAAIS